MLCGKSKLPLHRSYAFSDSQKPNAHSHTYLRYYAVQTCFTVLEQKQKVQKRHGTTTPNMPSRKWHRVPASAFQVSLQASEGVIADRLSRTPSNYVLST